MRRTSPTGRRYPPCRRPKELPSGLVTFMFTDIEGSTRLARMLGDNYGAVLGAHRTVLRTSLGNHGGVELFTEGDSFFVAFSDPSAAVAASVAAQRATRRIRLAQPRGAAQGPDGTAHRLATPSGGEYASPRCIGPRGSPRPRTAARSLLRGHRPGHHHLGPRGGDGRRGRRGRGGRGMGGRRWRGAGRPGGSRGVPAARLRRRRAPVPGRGARTGPRLPPPPHPGCRRPQPSGRGHHVRRPAGRGGGGDRTGQHPPVGDRGRAGRRRQDPARAGSGRAPADRVPGRGLAGRLRDRPGKPAGDMAAPWGFGPNRAGPSWRPWSSAVRRAACWWCWRPRTPRPGPRPRWPAGCWPTVPISTCWSPDGMPLGVQGETGLADSAARPGRRVRAARRSGRSRPGGAGAGRPRRRTWPGWRPRLDGLPLAVELAARRMRLLSAAQLAARLGDPLTVLDHAGRNGRPARQPQRERGLVVPQARRRRGGSAAPAGRVRRPGRSGHGRVVWRPRRWPRCPNWPTSPWSRWCRDRATGSRPGPGFADRRLVAAGEERGRPGPARRPGRCTRWTASRWTPTASRGRSR